MSVYRPPRSVEALGAGSRDTVRMSAEEERALAARFRAGDRAAGERLVRANLPFVVHIAREYRAWGVPLEDLVQQGSIGLLRAAERFDPDRCSRLVTYASYWIRAEIRENVVRGYRMVRVGTTKAGRRLLRLVRAAPGMDLERLSAQSGVAPAKLEPLLPLLGSRDVSLDQPGADGRDPMRRLASPQPGPEEAASDGEMRERLRGAIARALGEMGPRERMIADRRLMADEPETLEEIGAALGVSKERVRQIGERVRAKLRARLGPLREYAEAG